MGEWLENRFFFCCLCFLLLFKSCEFILPRTCSLAINVNLFWCINKLEKYSMVWVNLREELGLCTCGGSGSSVCEPCVQNSTHWVLSFCLRQMRLKHPALPKAISWALVTWSKFSILPATSHWFSDSFRLPYGSSSAVIQCYFLWHTHTELFTDHSCLFSFFLVQWSRETWVVWLSDPGRKSGSHNQRRAIQR